MKHVKRAGILVGVCAPFASKEWFQKEIFRNIEEDKNLEIKIETACQHEYPGKAMVAHVTMDKVEEISENLLSFCNENELGTKFVSF